MQQFLNTKGLFSLPILLFGMGGLSLVVGIFYLHHLNGLIVVEDARVKADIYTIRSHVNGKITASLFRQEGNVLSGNETVVELDVSELNAELSVIEAQRQELKQEYDLSAQQIDLLEKKIDFEHRAANLDFEQASESLIKQQIVATESGQEVARYFALQETGLATEKQVSIKTNEHNRNQRQLKIGQLEKSKKQLYVQKLELQQDQLKIERNKLAKLLFQIKALEAKQEQLRIQRDKHTYRMPETGRLDEVFVLSGEYVSEGERLFLMHSRSSIRISANVLESDIRHISPGKPAIVYLDAYPEIPFNAVVSKVSSLTQSQKSIVAPTQIVSNFIKISQRVEVELDLESHGLNIVPGMMSKVVFEK